MTRIGSTLGSTRPNRNGEQVTGRVHEAAGHRGDADSELLDPRYHPLPRLDERLTKPFGVEELLARMHVPFAAAGPAPRTPGRPRSRSGTSSQILARSVTKAGVPVRLTPNGVRAGAEPRLAALGRDPATLLLGPGLCTHTEYTRVQLRRLRAMLETPGKPALIGTEPPLGNRML